jgi:hypothetical protein
MARAIGYNFETLDDTFATNSKRIWIQIAPPVQLRSVALETVAIELVAPFHRVAAAVVFLDQLVDVITALPAAAYPRSRLWFCEF